MSEHSGDTLGNRFLAFTGTLVAIASVAGGLALYKAFLIKDNEDPDPAGTARRQEIVNAVEAEQAGAYNKVGEVEAGKTVTIPPHLVTGWAAKKLAAQKEAPGPIKTPEAMIRDAAPAPAAK